MAERAKRRPTSR